MCGIAGFIQARGLAEDWRASLATMTNAIMHRGPDDCGFWSDERSGVALGHRRLSIMDLSEAGHQPMQSASGRYVIVYNGEIYNHQDLRTSLDNAGQAPTWRGHSDTETILAAIDHWGVEKTLQKLNGMFAFALWDSAERQLYLARDRMGEKPLYYGKGPDGAFVFGSELKALVSLPGFKKEVNRDALALYLRHNYVPTPYSIWCGINKLPPAHFLIINPEQGQHFQPRCYWDFHTITQQGAANPMLDSPDLIDYLEDLLKDAVGRRMVADVPLGAFLSGGIDSSVIVAMMQAQSSQPVQTFSIGFHEKAFNEAVHAKAVAKHLGTDHTELYISSKDALDVIPKIPTIWDEPFADSSQIPTYLVSALTGQHVTVSLSGDGGDELFCGYGRYFRAHKLWRALSLAPSPVRHSLAMCMQSRAVQSLISGTGNGPRVADRLLKLAKLLDHQSIESLYHDLMSHWKSPEDIVNGGKERPTAMTITGPDFSDSRHKMMFLDSVSYLPDDILVKVDRAAMAVGLETRVPFLDHRLVELAWSLPMSAKVRRGEGKHILKEVLYRYVPQSLMERPKQGFGVPIDQWLRRPLKDWAECLLDERRLQDEGFFDPAPIRKLWQEHLSGRRWWHYYLWDVLMFQAWWAVQS